MSATSLGPDTCLIRSSVYAPRNVERPMQVLLLEVPQLLGLSRCLQLSRTCRDWMLACRTRFAGPPSSLKLVFGEDYIEEPDLLTARRVACMSIHSVLGAPGFNVDPQSLAIVEDEFFWFFADERSKKWEKEILQSPFQVHRAMAETTRVLRQRCRLSTIVIDELLRAPLCARPIHYAVLHSAPRLVRLILCAASRAGVLSETLQGFPDAASYTTVSPLFLAVLFSEQDVVNVLRRAGAGTNKVDVEVSLRLHEAQLWSDVAARFAELQLEAEAEQLLTAVLTLRDAAAHAAPAAQ